MKLGVKLNQKKHKGGRIFGQGAEGKVVDIKEVMTPNIEVLVECYDENLTIMPKSSGKGICGFCNFAIKINNQGTDLFNDDREETLTVLRKLVDNRSEIEGELELTFEDNAQTRSRKRQQKALLANLQEIANNIIVARCGVKDIFATSVGKPILFAVITVITLASEFKDGSRKSGIYPIYQRFTGSLADKKLSLSFETKHYVSILKTLVGSLKLLHSKQHYHNDVKPGNVLYRVLANKELDFELDFALSDFGQLHQINNRTNGTPEYQSEFYNNSDFLEEYSNSLRNVHPELFRSMCSDNDKYCKDVQASYKVAVNMYNCLKPKLLKACSSDNTNTETGDIATIIRSCASPSVSGGSNGTNGQNVEQQFLDVVQSSLRLLCGETDATCRAKCTETNTIANQIEKIILEKNDLFAVGMTMQHLEEQTKVPMPDNVRVIVDRLARGDVVANPPPKAAIFSTDEAWTLVSKLQNAVGGKNRRNNT